MPSAYNEKNFPRNFLWRFNLKLKLKIKKRRLYLGNSLPKKLRENKTPASKKKWLLKWLSDLKIKVPWEMIENPLNFSVAKKNKHHVVCFRETWLHRKLLDPRSLLTAGHRTDTSGKWRIKTCQSSHGGALIVVKKVCVAIQIQAKGKYSRL